MGKYPRAMIENAILETLEKLPDSLKQEVLHYAEFLNEKYTQKLSGDEVPLKKRRAGTLKGMFKLPLADDFDEPLEDFKEYME